MRLSLRNSPSSRRPRSPRTSVMASGASGRGYTNAGSAASGSSASTSTTDRAARPRPRRDAREGVRRNAAASSAASAAAVRRRWERPRGTAAPPPPCRGRARRASRRDRPDGRHRLALTGREGLAVEDDDDVLARPRVVAGLEALHGAEVRRLLAQADGEKFADRIRRHFVVVREVDGVGLAVAARAARRAVVQVERGHVGRRQPGLDVEPGRVAPPLHRDAGRREDDRDVAPQGRAEVDAAASEHDPLLAAALVPARRRRMLLEEPRRSASGARKRPARGAGARARPSSTSTSGVPRGSSSTVVARLGRRS